MEEKIVLWINFRDFFVANWKCHSSVQTTTDFLFKQRENTLHDGRAIIVLFLYQSLKIITTSKQGEDRQWRKLSRERREKKLQ